MMLGLADSSYFYFVCFRSEARLPLLRKHFISSLSKGERRAPQIIRRKNATITESLDFSKKL